MAILLPLVLCPGALFSGCAMIGPQLPPVNLQEPGWTVLEGQAVWHRPKQKLELAGDILVATRPDGAAFVQFTKSPFPLFLAHSTPGKWSIDIPPENKHYAGRGTPPKRIIWLHLPPVLAGQPPPKNWTWNQSGSNWRLENHISKEALEGYFNQ